MTWMSVNATKMPASDADLPDCATWGERLEFILPGKGATVIRRLLYPPHVRIWHAFKCLVSGWEGYDETVHGMVLESAECRDAGELLGVFAKWRRRMVWRRWVVPSDRRGMDALEASGMRPADA